MAKPAAGATLDPTHGLFASLAAYWWFPEGSGSASADAKGTNILALSGGAWAVDAAGDACYRIATAAASPCLLTTPINLPGTSSWSVAWRAKLLANDLNGMVWGNNDTNEFAWMNGGTAFSARLNNNTFDFNPPSVFTTEADFVLTFNHAAGSNRLRLLVNGVEVGGSPQAGNADTSLKIATLMAGYSGATFGGQMTLSLFAYWDGRVLDATDAAALHANPYAMLLSSGVSGSVNDTLPAATVAASGAVAVAGAVAKTLAPATLAAAGTVAGAAGIALTTPVQYQTYQRNGSDQADIPITGTYSGAPVHIEASFNGGAYQTIVASPSGGTFSGTLTNQAAGQGTLTVRFTDTPAALATRADVGIGDVFPIIGDSIPNGRLTNPQNMTAFGAIKATCYEPGVGWKQDNDPTSGSTSSGSFWPLLGSTLIRTTSTFPVAFINCAVGSTGLTFGGGGWLKSQSPYYSAMAAAITAAAVGNPPKGFVGHFGANDAADGSQTISQAAYLAVETQLVTDLRGDYPGTTVFFAQLGNLTTGSPPDRRTAMDNVRAATTQAWALTGAAPGPVLYDLVNDGVHYTTDAQGQAVADRWWVAITNALYSLSNGRGPRLTSAVFNPAKTQITVNLDRALSNSLSSAVLGFRVKDGGTPVTISSQTVTASTIVTLVLSAAVVGAGTLSYASQNDANNVAVPLTPAITLSDARTLSLPAEPILDSTVSPAGTIAGVLTETLPAPTLAAAGAVAVAGQVAKSLPAPTLVAPGAVAIQGTLAETLPAPTVEAAGDMAGAHGDLADALPAPTLSAEGTVSASTTPASGGFTQPPFWARGRRAFSPPHAVPMLVTPPVLDPLTLDEAKLAAGLDWAPGDPRDALMQRFIRAATRKVQTDTGIVLLTTGYDLLFDHLPPGQPIALPWRPVQSVTVAAISVASVSTPIAAGDVVLDPGGAAPIAARVWIAPTAWPSDLRRFQPWILHLVVGYSSVDLLNAADPMLVHLVARLVAHYATLGRDLASINPATQVPMGYSDDIAPYIPVVVA